jgi:hypothetical protein
MPIMEDPRNQLSPTRIPSQRGLNVQRGVPNVLASPLLFVLTKRGERRYYNKEVVATAKGTELCLHRV